MFFITFFMAQNAIFSDIPPREPCLVHTPFIYPVVQNFKKKALPGLIFIHTRQRHAGSTLTIVLLHCPPELKQVQVEQPAYQPLYTMEVFPVSSAVHVALHAVLTVEVPVIWHEFEAIVPSV